MRYRGALLATAILAAPFAASAQPISGLYVNGNAGFDLLQNVEVTPIGPGFGPGYKRIQPGAGFTGIGAVGWAFGNGLRLELQGDYIQNNIRHFNGTPFPTAATNNLQTYGVMGNAVFDLDIGMPFLYPYLGLGAGYQFTHLNKFSAAEPGGGFAVASNDTTGSFAAQVIAGLSFPVPNVPGLSVTTEYRFMDILGGEKFSSVVSSPEGTAPATLKLHNQFHNQFLVGVRYAFNVPPPPSPAAAPEAAPTPAPARSYLVFFDWDKATLTERARQIVRAAAESSTHVQYTRIEVNGYTDTSGTPKYNQGLSVRRANAVAAELVKDGVPKTIISIQGFGDTRLLVPTGPGVREPQNRRVEIVIQ
jgi:outer membrane protein OmpA-like peptidoglycan-associated protein